MQRSMHFVLAGLIFIVSGGYRNPYAADQQLHHRVNSEPIDSLALRVPIINNTKKYELVLLVISAAWEMDTREEIRKLWASKEESTMQKEGKSLVIFLVGQFYYVEKEAAKYGDLLQVDVRETYRNLVYKIEAGFRWINAKIKSDFVVKVDSDSVVHIDRLHGNLLKVNKVESNHWFMCSCAQESPLIRDKYSKWYVAESDYAPAYYPDYCSGAGYAMKRETFDKIVERMGKHRVFEIEDAFFTGVVREDLGEVMFYKGAVARGYTIFSDCHGGEPILSILNTEGQFSHYGGYGTDLAAAWRILKQAYCNHGW